MRPRRHAGPCCHRCQNQPRVARQWLRWAPWGLVGLIAGIAGAVWLTHLFNKLAAAPLAQLIRQYAALVEPDGGGGTA